MGSLNLFIAFKVFISTQLGSDLLAKVFRVIYINDNQLDNWLYENSRRIIKIHPNINNQQIATSQENEIL